jgi:hypothetical protein
MIGVLSILEPGIPQIEPDMDGAKARKESRCGCSTLAIRTGYSLSHHPKDDTVFHEFLPGSEVLRWSCGLVLPAMP